MRHGAGKPARHNVAVHLQVADALHAATGGADVVLFCSAAHMCMVARGVERHAAETLTTAARGDLEADAERRSQWLELLLSTAQEFHRSHT
jgi:GTP cyclohydrolase IA